jgi:murein L,D-transpeptidase YafK
MRSLALKLLLILALLAALFAMAVYSYTRIAARYGSLDAAPPMASAAEQADAIVVSKSAQRMRLLREGAVIREYRISLGGNPQGHKQQEGDNRTPEGQYLIDWRNEKSAYHLSLHISYPNADDRQRASNVGVEPGGNVMIHGLPNGWGFVGPWHQRWNWTQGCIAVTDQEMRDIWPLVPNGTPILIES